MSSFIIRNSNRTENDNEILTRMPYSTTVIRKSEYKNGLNGSRHNEPVFDVVPVTNQMEFRVAKKIPKTGVMLAGWGGNNGTTFTGVVLANHHKINWETKMGIMKPNYYGSMLLSSTTPLGILPDPDETGTIRELCVPLCDLVPILNPNSLEIDGWDVNSLGISDAMYRAQVFDISLQKQLAPLMKDMKPRKSIFNVDFVAHNQETRADNILTGTWREQIEQIRADIRDFKEKKGLDRVIVLWTASTERFTDIVPGINDTAENLMKAIDKNEVSTVAPSTLFGVASVLEKCCFINGSPQNSLVPGLVELAKMNNVHLAGDDFKTGQTKIKSALVEFLVGSGIKPVSIVSYNHLGNNDGYNLSQPKQFRSKEITKSGVIEDMVSTNSVLYEPGEKPDHCIVIKYVPYVRDSKRALDEYTSEICMHGVNTIAIHNTCEDSLLATTVMLDLVLLTELFQRISFRVSSDDADGKVKMFDTIFSALGFLLKSPTTAPGEPSINAFSRQRSCIENLLRCCAGLPPHNNMYLERKMAQ